MADIFDFDDPDDFMIVNGIEAFKIESWLEPTDLKIKSLWEWSDPEDTPLRIAVCGAGGTGKKRLAKDLGDKIGVPVIEGVARTLHRLGYKLNKSTAMETQYAAFFSLFFSTMEFSEALISAGSLIDILAYTKYLSDRTNDVKVIDMHRAMANCVKSFIYDMYSVFFYLPVSEKPKSDGIRSVDMKFQKEIDWNIRYYLNAFDIDYFPIIGSDKKKLETAHDYLDEFQLLIDRDL